MALAGQHSAKRKPLLRGQPPTDLLPEGSDRPKGQSSLLQRLLQRLFQGVPSFPRSYPLTPSWRAR